LGKSFLPKNIDSFIAFILGFFMVLFSAPGIGLSPDSIVYLSTARNLFSHGGLNSFDGEWLTDFPAGYPVFLSLIMFITRIDFISSGLVINGMLFGLLNVICLQQATKNGLPYYLKWLYSVLILFSPALLHIYGMLWSETLFIFCITVFLTLSADYGSSHEIKFLIAMALISGFICVVRYIGITILFTGSILLLIDRSLAFRKRLAHLLIYGSIGGSFLMINLIVNRAHSTNAAGERVAAASSILHHLSRFGETLTSWLPIPITVMPSFINLFSGIGFIAAALAGIWYLLRSGKNMYGWFHLGLLFTAIYSICLIALSTVTVFDPIDSRLLSPLYLPALGVIIKAVHTAVSNGKIGLVKAIALTLIFIVGITGFQRQYKFFVSPELVKADKYRYDFDDFGVSPTIEFIRIHPLLFRSNKNIYSNAGDLLYMFGTPDISGLPRLDSKEEMQDFILYADYLIWLNHKYIPGDYLNKLKQKSVLKPLYSFSDGVIFTNK